MELHKGTYKKFLKLGKKNKTKKIKKNLGIVTFSPLPSEFFQKERKNIRITLDDIKIDLLKKIKQISFLFVILIKNFHK